jgi:predicted transcriptional regulator
MGVTGGLNLRRGRFEIMGEILSLTADGDEGAVKTSIVYDANLNFKVANKYLSMLLDEGLVRLTDRPTAKYKITERGLRFLDMYKDLKGMAKNL